MGARRGDAKRNRAASPASRSDKKQAATPASRPAATSRPTSAAQSTHPTAKSTNKHGAAKLSKPSSSPYRKHSAAKAAPAAFPPSSGKQRRKSHESKGASRRAASAKAAACLGVDGGADSDDPDGVVDALLGKLRTMVDDDGSGGEQGSDVDELRDVLADVDEMDGMLASDDGDSDGDTDGDSDEEEEESADAADLENSDGRADENVDGDGRNGVDEADDDDDDDDDDGDDDDDDEDDENDEGDEESEDPSGADNDDAEDDGADSDDDEDVDVGTLSMHKDDLEELKTSDPTFYKYLQENDAGLLDVGDDADADADADGDEDDDAVSGSDESAGNTDDQSGDDRDEDSDDDAAEEAAAAAEAGLGVEADLDDVEGSDSDSEDADAKCGDTAPRASKLVDMATIRDLEKQLSLNRGALKAAKHLMRMFRAGRELTTVAQGSAPTKAQQAKPGNRRRKETCRVDNPDGEVSDDEFVDDGSFSAGHVKFATTRVYQKVMYLAIVRVQETLDKMLGKPKRTGTALAARWTPSEHARWKNLEPMFTSYVSQMLALTAGMKDATTLRFLLKRSELLVPYTRGNARLAKRLIKLAVNVWASETRDNSEATKLRAYLLLRSIADEPDNVESVLRVVYTSFYTGISRTCNPRTLPNIMFAAKCIVDLFGVDMAASYTVAFSYLREMAVTLRSVLTAKDRKEDADKVHNWSFVNSLRVLSMILATYGAETELRPLIYPYVQIAIGVMRVQPTPRTYPMRLHIASYLTSIVSSTGVYIPVGAHLVPLLRCGELRRKVARGATKELEWRALLRVSDDTVKTKPYLTGLVNGTVMQLSAFFAAVSRHVSFPELSHEVAQSLRKFSKDAKVAEWRATASALGDKLRDTAKLVADARARADFGPHGAAGSCGMLEVVPGLDENRRMPVQRFYDVEVARVKREEALRDEGLIQKDEAKRKEVEHEVVRNGQKRGRDMDDDEENTCSEDEADTSEDDDEAGARVGKERRKAARQSKKVRSDKAVAANSGIARPMFHVGKSGELEGDDGYDSDVVGDLTFSSDEE
jgi:nucleolar complex protein 2